MREHQPTRATANGNVTSVSAPYKQPVNCTIMNPREKIRGTGEQRASGLNATVKFTGASTSVLLYKSCLWRKQDCRLS